ncbi:MAG: 3'-5' exonuclease [Thermotaleaceae bacterium]
MFFCHTKAGAKLQGKFPTASSITAYESGNPRTLEEARRLFYVAMTRAKDALKSIIKAIRLT